MDTNTKALSSTNLCGVQSFFLEEDKRLRRQALSAINYDSVVALFCTTLGVGLVGYFFSALEPLCIFLIIVLVPIVLIYSLGYLRNLGVGLIRWSKLQDFQQARQGLSRFLSGQQLPSEYIYAVGDTGKHHWVFEDAQQRFLFITKNKVCNIELRRCDDCITQDGGWNLLAYPINELFQFIAFQKVPKGDNLKICGLHAINAYLRETNQSYRKVMTFQPVNEKVGVYYTDSQGEGGLCCICAEDNNGEGLVFITEDDRWHTFAKIWEKIF